MVDMIIRYENGETSDKETLEMFSKLIKSGQVWSLQGHYGRTARALIDDGWLSSSGELTDKALENGLA